MPFIDVKTLKQREQIPGYHASFIHSHNMTLVYWDIKKGAKLPEHFHRHEQVANVTKGRFELTVGDETKILKPGSVAVIPSNVKHSGKAITDCHIIDVFYPVREDYQFKD